MSSISGSSQNPINAMGGLPNTPASKRGYLITDLAAAASATLPDLVVGNIVKIPALTVGTQTFVLPSPINYAGQTIDIVTNATVGQIARLDNGAGGIVGSILTTSGAGGAVPVWVNNVRYLQFAAAAVAGSAVRLVSDGAVWIVNSTSPGAIATICFSTA